MSIKKNVLLVDDDHIFNYLNQRIIQKMGFTNEIHSARNGQEAIELINQYLAGTATFPDVIFLDLNMPVMDGFTFLEVFNKMNIPGKEKISIIIVSSSQNPKDIQRARSLGIDHYLSKPITEENIKEALSL